MSPKNSTNISNRQDIARALNAETRMGYQRALERVVDAAAKGLLPAVLDAAGRAEAVRILSAPTGPQPTDRKAARITQRVGEAAPVASPAFPLWDGAAVTWPDAGTLGSTAPANHYVAAVRGRLRQEMAKFLIDRAGARCADADHCWELGHWIPSDDAAYAVRQAQQYLGDRGWTQVRILWARPGAPFAEPEWINVDVTSVHPRSAGPRDLPWLSAYDGRDHFALTLRDIAALSLPGDDDETAPVNPDDRAKALAASVQNPDLERVDGARRGALYQARKDEEELLRASAHPDRPALVPLGGVGTGGGEVALDLDAPFLGHPTRQTRDLLKRAGTWGLTLREVREHLAMDDPQALAYLGAMADQGLLIAPGTGTAADRDGGRWKITADGVQLGRGTGRKVITRARADALAAKVVTAARDINADPDSLWWVKEIRAAGPYSDPGREQLLHVDLAVHLSPRLSDQTEQAKAEARMEDDARDAGMTGLVRDMVGYGHWRTRLALAGKGTTVRLFMLHPYAEEGTVLFREDRDLTVSRTTPQYRKPEPGTVGRCSWCRRDLPATRISRPGEPRRSSPIALCEDCQGLGGVFGRADDYQEVYPHASYKALKELQEGGAFHGTGCALCGRLPATGHQWWEQWSGSDEPDAVLRLCQVCPGLLGLADRREREQEWRELHQSACLTGMHAILREEAGLEPFTVPTRKRRLPRLTAFHQQILEAITVNGVISAADMDRIDHAQEIYRKRDWWQSRMGHLLQHDLVTPVGGEWKRPWSRMRAMDDEERDLVRKMRELHVPGPVWNGTAAVELQPPADWVCFADQLKTLADKYDRLALGVREAAQGRHV
ncbi:hypothetical protein [Streptomyces sp. NBC_00582]|uniref:hypothetical protein n=1 Tax=Streptomyces sp. NBC_00582 TaxID=2975783 RepID=UPI002E823E78|nr:hypothetical protein [Streptomyces sp. NBC_00582]WUB68456.1 hypothetical protein OG852_50030 [Streptomyces sp. NBC_00582]